jgi:hypothetical protein
MKKNAIILTPGLAGSSVLTALVARAGYWTGDHTFKKEDYDTHENEQLVDLNKRLFSAAGYRGDYTMEFSPTPVERIAALYGRIDPKPYEDFLMLCNQNRPWIWKDPRLWLTIRYWRHFLNRDECAYIILTRDLWQMWLSTTLRRQIQTFDYLQRYVDGIVGSVKAYLEDSGGQYLSLEYEELILRPEPAIAQINQLLGTELVLDDLAAVYTKPLYQNPRSFWEYSKAMLIYAKNYGQRYR